MKTKQLLFLEGFFFGVLTTTLLLVCILYPIVSKAAQITFGPEIFMKKGTSLSTVKHLNIAKEFKTKHDNVFWKLKAGYWADNRPGAKDAFQFGPSIGLVLKPFKYFDVRVEAGIIGISKTDSYLGSWWNITECISGGFRDTTAVAAIQFCHYSSGRSDVSNQGRNPAMLMAGIGF